MRDDEKSRCGDRRWKEREVEECITNVYGNGAGRLSKSNHSFLQMLPFLPPERRSLILGDAVVLRASESILAVQDLLAVPERQRVIREMFPRMNVRNQLAIFSELKGASDLLTSNQLNGLVDGLVSFMSDPGFALQRAQLPGVLPFLDDRARAKIFDAAISNQNEASRCYALTALAWGVGHLNQEQYERLLGAFIAMPTDRSGRGLYAIAKHANELNEKQRGQLFSFISQVQDQRERGLMLANLRSGLSAFSPEQRNQVFDAALKSGATVMLKDLCQEVGLLDEERRNLLCTTVAAVPASDAFRPGAVEKLAGQIAYLSPDQVAAVAEMATGTRNGLAELVRGRSLAKGEQGECINAMDIVSLALRADDEDRRAAAISVLSPVVDLLSEEELSLFVDTALNLSNEDVKAAAVSAVGQELHRLSEPLRERTVQGAERMVEGNNKVAAVIGLSRGMSRLSQEQCAQLVEVARSASPSGRFDEHNVSALHALVTAEWR